MKLDNPQIFGYEVKGFVLIYKNSISLAQCTHLTDNLLNLIINFLDDQY